MFVNPFTAAVVFAVFTPAFVFLAGAGFVKLTGVWVVPVFDEDVGPSTLFASCYHGRIFFNGRMVSPPVTFYSPPKIFLLLSAMAFSEYSSSVIVVGLSMSPSMMLPRWSQ